MLASVRTDVKLIRREVSSLELKEWLKDVRQRIDIIGCDLTQSIKVKLKKKTFKDDLKKAYIESLYS